MGKTHNGRNVTIKILTSILLLVLAAWGGVAFTKADAVAEDLETHAHLKGHPVVIERVETLQTTVDEIRSDVKTLLRRKP